MTHVPDLPKHKDDSAATSKTADTNSQPTQPKPSLMQQLRSRALLAVPTLLAIALLVVWGVKQWQLTEVREARENDRTEFAERMSENLFEQQAESLTVLTKTLVWSVRSALLRDNIDQLNVYISDLVKVPGFAYIAIANSDDTIIAATDKKAEGVALTTHFPAATTQTNTVDIVRNGKTVMHISAPIMGFDSRIGTLYIEYRANLHPTEELAAL